MRKYAARTFVAAAFTATLVGTTVAQAATRTVELRSGQTKGVSVFYLYNPGTCGRLAFPKVQIRQPKNGKIFTKRTRTTVNKGVCKGKKMDGIGVYYKANSGFRGRDRGKVTFRFPQGADGSGQPRGSGLTIKATVK